MYFEREHGFDCELMQAEPNEQCRCKLTSLVRRSCETHCSTRSWWLDNLGVVQVEWKRATLMVFYCRNGDTLYLRSIIP